MAFSFQSLHYRAVFTSIINIARLYKKGVMLRKEEEAVCDWLCRENDHGGWGDAELDSRYLSYELFVNSTTAQMSCEQPLEAVLLVSN